MSNTENLLPLIKILKKWIRPILAVIFLSVGVTVVVSLTMDNYYKASTVFYAASADLSKPSPIGGMEIDMEYYGRDEDVDRLLSIANSGELANRMIEEFSLASHYEIKSDSPKGRNKVIERFRKLFSAQRNKFDAIEISVEDKNPELAATIANRSRDFINEVAQRVVKESQEMLISKYVDNIAEKQKGLDSLNQRLEKEKQTYGIYDSENQGQVLAEMLATTQTKTIFIDAKLSNFENQNKPDSVAFYKALKKSLNNQINTIKEQIGNYNKGISIVSMLEQEQKEFVLQLSLDKERYKHLVAAKAAAFPAIHLVEDAEPPLVKSRPKRSILVIASGIISLLFSLFAVVVVEKFREINWKEI